MQRLPKTLIPIVFLLIAVGSLTYGLRSSDEKAKTEIRVGWQTAWADQGQIIQALEHTNIPWLYDLRLSFAPFQYGPDQNAAALGGKIDAVNAGIVPVINLLSRDTSWIAIARVVDFTIAIVARNDAGIAQVADLKGKKFGVPIGGGSHPYAFDRLKNAGLNADKTPRLVEVIDVAPNQMATSMRAKAIDAAAVWEPTLTLLLRQGATVVDSTVYPSFLLMKRAFVDQHRELVIGFLAALIEANYFVGQHKAQTNGWFARVSKYDSSLVDSLKTVEANFRQSDFERISIEIRPPDITLTQNVADFMLDNAMIAKRLDFASSVQSDVIHAAIERVKRRGSQASRLEITAP
jgi:ABC-type nitrate/sulfonate/bicarbonate transport system substrate-binding protein